MSRVCGANAAIAAVMRHKPATVTDVHVFLFPHSVKILLQDALQTKQINRGFTKKKQYPINNNNQLTCLVY